MRKRALIFDDDDNFLYLIAMTLKNHNFECFSFSSPLKCPLYLAKGCQCPYKNACADIIVTDVQMPCASGLELADKLIKGGCKTNRIALMSASWSDRDVVTAEKLGCRIFQKMFPMHKFEEWLTQIEKDIPYDRVLTNWFDTSMPQMSYKIVG